MIIDLFKVSKKDINLVGGKAANLGELSQAGFKVPSGFVITSKTDNQEEIFRFFDQLHAQKIAVRSSAVSEDSTTDSWAGQLESYLNTTRETLIEKIFQCFDSLKSPRALAYGKRLGVNSNELTMAVIVQAMVDSQAAGVIFTANPVTQNKEEMVIEAVKGLGDQLVQGEVTPASFLIDKTNDSISNQEEITPEWKNFSLSMLTAIGIQVEQHFGFPCDIEWAIDQKDQIWLLQSRPITTL